MSDRRIIVLPAELVVKVDENRGDMSRAEFIDLLLDSHLGNDKEEQNPDLVTRESLADFERGIKELLRSFLEFFVTYSLEIGKESGDIDLEYMKKSRVTNALTDHLRKKISAEDYDRIRKQTYHEYLDSLGPGASEWRDHTGQLVRDY